MGSTPVLQTGEICCQDFLLQLFNFCYKFGIFAFCLRIFTMQFIYKHYPDVVNTINVKFIFQNFIKMDKCFIKNALFKGNMRCIHLSLLDPLGLNVS